jgi:2-polyprenyl-3-methyl-5-hydroxy-6-metoxy-1,4-benzoquinol methylase
VFSLGLQPLANDWKKPGEPRAGYAPLEVLLCPQCNLAQLSVVVDPAIMYGRYPYVTSQSAMMRAHFEALWRDVSAGRPIKRALEIGSNDGTLLHWIKTERGVEDVWGVEPAVNLGVIAREKGIHGTCGLFSADLAKHLIDSEVPAPDVIIARHVLCHVDDWRDFFKGIEMLCGPQTLVVIENPWVQDVLDNNSFDQIYHEHLSYLSIRSILSVLCGTTLQLARVVHYPIHGGAIALMIQRVDAKEGMLGVDPSVAEFVAKEDADPRPWGHFNMNVRWLQQEVAGVIRDLRESGQTVAALGASAKATVWANACRFTRKDIAWVADSTLAKQYTTVPGTDIPVVDEGAITRDLPDYVLNFAWNFWGQEMADKFEFYRQKGGKFILPVPRLRIV